METKIIHVSVTQDMKIFFNQKVQIFYLFSIKASIVSTHLSTAEAVLTLVQMILDMLALANSVDLD